MENKLRIISVDDEPNNQKLMKLLLESEGHQVFLFCNGLDCLDFLSENNVDIIFMDIGLPNLTGYQVAEEIRNREEQAFSYTPIIATTAYAVEDSMSSYTKSGMDDYIIKPFTIDDIRKAISTYCLANRSESRSEKLTSEGLPAPC